MARITLPEGDSEDWARFWSLRPEFGKAADQFSGVIQDRSILAVREQEAARARVAEINQCMTCLAARIEDMDGHDIDESFYSDVNDPTKRGRYSERERLAIEFAERFCWGADHFDDIFWERMNRAFSPAEIVDLAAGCAKWMGLGRINAVLDLAQSCPITIKPSQQAARQA